MTTPRWGWLLGVMILESGRGKGTSLNSTCLTPKPLASCLHQAFTCMFPRLHPLANGRYH